MNSNKFTNVTIEHFRGIKELQLKELKQVNLFLGKNNCGKTSVLDALFVLAGIANPRVLVSINAYRDYSTTKGDDFLLNFYNFDDESTITIKDVNNSLSERELNVTLTMGYNSSANSLSSEDKRVCLGLNSRITVQEKETNAAITSSDLLDDGTIKYTPASSDVNIKAMYLNSKVMFDTVGLASLIEHKQDGEIVAILKKVEPKIERIAMIDKKVMVDVGLNKLVPINLLGDGIRKLLSIVLTMYQCKDGMVMIDEIDNGLHYSALKDLWIAILETARKLDVQMFATTHNIDSLRALQQALLTDEYKDMQQETVSYSLMHLPTDELKAYRYDFEKYNFAIEQEIEMR